MGTAWHATLTQRPQPTKYTPSWQRLPTGSDAPAGQRASRATRPATSQKLHRNDPGNMTKSLRHQQNSPDPNQVEHLWEVPDPWRLSRGDLWYQGVGNSTPLGARWGLPNTALSRKGEHYFQFIFSFISCFSQCRSNADSHPCLSRDGLFAKYLSICVVASLSSSSQAKPRQRAVF